MTRLLITGGCGFVGSNLIALLNDESDYDIRVIDDESLGKQEYVDGDFEFVRGDIRDLNILGKALEGVDAVVHLAADTRVMDSIEDPSHNFSVNVVGTFNLLSLMRKKGVPRIVNASTGGAILGEATPPVHEEMVPKPLAPYGASKLAVEGYCSAFAGSYGLKATSLRFSNIYGPRSFHKGSVVAHFFKQILSDRPLVIYGDGSQKRDYVFSADLCGGINQALQSDLTGVFQLGTGIPTSLNELINIMKKVVGPNYRFQVKYEALRSGEILHTYCDISNARKTLGYDPTTKVQEGLEQTWRWFVDNKKRLI